MQSWLSEPPDDMALRNDDKKWILEQISAAVREHLKPHGWRRLQQWLPTVAMIALIVSMLGLAGAAWNYAFSRVEKEARFEEDTKNALDRIESELRPLRASDSPGPVLKELSKLNQEEFSKSLLALQRVAQKPPSEVKPSIDTLENVSERLLNVSPDTSNYWPTVLQFLHFATEGISTGVPPPGPPTLVLSRSHMERMQLSGVRLLLDGGLMSDSTISNSRITFTENPVQLINVNFINCAFDLPVIANPNKYLRDAAKTLLASSPGSVRFSSLS